MGYGGSDDGCAGVALLQKIGSLIWSVLVPLNWTVILLFVRFFLIWYIFGSEGLGFNSLRAHQFIL